MISTKEQPRLSIGTMIEDLEIIKVLSIGAFGQVYLARHQLTFKRYAIKSLPHIGLDAHQLAFQRNEITLHAQVSDHPNIIRLERVIETAGWTHAVLEYGSEGDLFSSITEKGLYYGNHELIKRVFLQLIDAVRYCHENQIYHRDLKPENILTFQQGYQIKLADFGLATTDSISTDYGCGSTFYYSPECQGGLDRQRKMGYATGPNDIWALGIILINLSAGRNPWRLASLEDDTFCGFLHDPNLLLKILPISNELNKILKRIFCLDPHRRITLDELAIRIEQCKFFTRTPEVIQYETMMAAKTKRIQKKSQIRPIQTKPNVSSLLPSPPTTPHKSSDRFSISSDSSSNSSLTDLIDIEQPHSYPIKKNNLDSHYIQIV